MDAFEKIYRTYFKDVFLYLRSISLNDDIADELTAETFFKAMQSLDSFRGTCDIRVWLCQIAKNSYLSYLRKKKRIVDIEAAKEIVEEVDFVQSLSDEKDAMKIHQIIHNLDEPYKEIISLRIFGELSFKQIAKIFNKSENWACVTYHRACMKIKKKMEVNNEDNL